MEAQAKSYTVGQIFDKTVRRINHFEGNISIIIGTPLVRTSDSKEIEKMQNAMSANSKELIKFLSKVFNSADMGRHLADKIYDNCGYMQGFYLNFDESNRNYFLFNEY